jgi:hypothetical protein
VPALVRARVLQATAAGACVLSVALLAYVQFATRTHPPATLFLLFAGVWVFGAVMLYAAPTFGAVGTALYGILLGADVLAMHGALALNILLAGVSFATSALALAFLVVHRRRGAA